MDKKTSPLWHTGAPTADWDNAQAKLGAHFLQGSHWARFQVSLGKLAYYASGDGWSWVAFVEKSHIGVRLYCPYGPTLANPKALQPALRSLVACARAHRAMFIRIEPQGPVTSNALHSAGLRKTSRDIQPHYTWVKDLDASEENLIADMTATNRNLYRTANTKGLSFRSSNNPADIQHFLRLMHEVAQHNRIIVHSDNYFTTMAEILLPAGAGALYFAEHEKKIIAASFVFDSPTTRYYAHAGSQFDMRKLHPGSPLVSRMIVDAKQKGLRHFDFCGIAPPDQPNHPWTGITTFKQSFGGRAVDMHGTWELPIRSLSYRTYTALRKLVS